MDKKSKNRAGMRTGLVLGKFMPLHNGHLALIADAYNNCDQLNVLLCVNTAEEITKEIRTAWLEDTLTNYPGAKLHVLEYDEKELPATSESSKEVSKLWAKKIYEILPETNIIFTSEKYGEYVAEFLNIEHKEFDIARAKVPVSATQIRNNPFLFWEHIPDNVKPFFVKKVCLVGSESTGKSTLTEKLAAFFNTSFVPEMAREIIEKTEECTFEDLYAIAMLHAKTIEEKIKCANKLLFIDTDVNITNSYADFLFGQNMQIEETIRNTNKCDLYFYLETDCPYVQDGTRLNEEEREKLSVHHKQVYTEQNIPLVYLTGSWEKRYNDAVDLLKKEYHL